MKLLWVLQMAVQRVHSKALQKADRWGKWAVQRVPPMEQSAGQWALTTAVLMVLQTAVRWGRQKVEM